MGIHINHGFFEVCKVPLKCVLDPFPILLVSNILSKFDGLLKSIFHDRSNIFCKLFGILFQSLSIFLCFNVFCKIFSPINCHLCCMLDSLANFLSSLLWECLWYKLSELTWNSLRAYFLAYNGHTFHGFTKTLPKASLFLWDFFLHLLRLVIRTCYHRILILNLFLFLKWLYFWSFFNIRRVWDWVSFNLTCKLRRSANIND